MTYSFIMNLPARRQTYLLFFREAHDSHGLHGLGEDVLVLLARDRHIAVGQEAVVVVSLKAQFGWKTTGTPNTMSLKEVQPSQGHGLLLWVMAEVIHGCLQKEQEETKLTAQLVSRSCEHVVEDVEGPLVFGLSDGTGFLQQILPSSQGIQ